MRPNPKSTLLFSVLLIFVAFLLPACAISEATSPKNNLPVTYLDIEKAQQILKPVALHTPLIEEQALSQITGAKVYLKLENLQYTGSFKIRGAFNKIASLKPEQRQKGVICASAGNHAQGVALAAKFFGIKATIVMPETVPITKLNATKAYGANVVLKGKTFDDALAKANALQKQTKAYFIHPFDDPLTIAGQGTIGLEILEDLPDVDAVLIPIGGGGLASGISTAIKAQKPAVKIIGVEPENAACMKHALQKGKPTFVKIKPTIAEGTAVAKSGLKTYLILQKMLDGLVTVNEEEIEKAVLLLLCKDKILAEGAGALGAAALLSKKLEFKGKNVVLIVSGGNIDLDELAEIISKYKKKQ